MGKLWEPGPQYEQARRFRKRGRSIFAEAPKTGNGKKRMLVQAGASVLIFFLIWGLFRLDSPRFAPAQARIRVWFTEDYDLQPVLRMLTEVGIWGDTLDRAAFETMKTTDDPGYLTVPVSGQVTGAYGWMTAADESKRFIDGIIIAAPEGTPIRAALGGNVTRIANEEEKGRLMEITADNGFRTTYAHCSEILVDLNDKILTGQVIGRVGKTGNCSHPQLFFRLEKEGISLDPARFFVAPGEKT